jgi:hypothetical protein
VIRVLLATSLIISLAGLTGCKRDESPKEKPADSGQTTETAKASPDEHAHPHPHGEDDGHDHAGEEMESGSAGHGHEHAEISLGVLTLGELKATAAQSHGKLAPAKEGHLVVKLPYNDSGATVVRAWIGTSDRTKSYVGKGKYAPSHDDYDIHAMAPDPLPENVMWWVEIEKPDGTKLVGSVKPLLE